MACCAWLGVRPLRPAIIKAAWAAAGFGPSSKDWDRRLVGSTGNWTMGWAMGGTLSVVWPILLVTLVFDDEVVRFMAALASL